MMPRKIVNGFIPIKLILIFFFLVISALLLLRLFGDHQNQAEIIGATSDNKVYRMAEYNLPEHVDPAALRALKPDYLIRGTESPSKVLELLTSAKTNTIFGTTTMVHKHYIPQLNSGKSGSQTFLKAIHDWATANGEGADPSSEYAICFNEQNSVYAIGWTDKYTDDRLDQCISAIRKPFGDNDPRNASWQKTKIIVNLGSPTDNLSKNTELSQWNAAIGDSPQIWCATCDGSANDNHSYFIGNSAVSYLSQVKATPEDTRSLELAKLVDAKSDAIKGGTFWQAKGTELPQTLDIKLVREDTPLPSFVNRIRLYPKLDPGKSGPARFELYAVDSQNEKNIAKIESFEATLTNGQMIERIYQKPLCFSPTGKLQDNCFPNADGKPVSRILVKVLSWPGKVGFYETEVYRKADQNTDGATVVGFFPKWPNYIINALKNHKDDIYGFGLHYYPGFNCVGMTERDTSLQQFANWKTDDLSFIECTKEYLHRAKLFLSENGLSDKKIFFTEWGSTNWADPNTEFKRLSWQTPYRWFQFWNMLRAEGVQGLAYYAPIYVKDFQGFDPSVQCKPENKQWDCPPNHTKPNNLGCKVAPAGLISACDENNPLKPSKTLNPFGVAFAQLADIESGSSPYPPTIVNGDFENGLAEWQMCGDSRTKPKPTLSTPDFSYTREIVRQDQISGKKSFHLNASEKGKNNLEVGICQNSIWPVTQLSVRYQSQTKNDENNGFIVYAKDSKGIVRIGYNQKGNLNIRKNDLTDTYKLKIKTNPKQKAKINLNFAQLYFKKYARGIDPEFTMGIQAVANDGTVDLIADDVITKDYFQQIGSPIFTQVSSLVDD